MEKDFVLPSKAICNFFKITRQTLKNWKDTPGFPKNARVRHGLYDLKILSHWYLTHFMGDAEISKRMLAEKLKYQEARSLREKLEVDELQGKLINLELLSKDLSYVFLRMKSAMLLWEKRLPGLLEGKPQKAMYAIIHKEVTDILRHFAQGTKTLCSKKGRTEK